jgi:pimeloyl-ACP methyl ester carboxylesterase
MREVDMLVRSASVDDAAGRRRPEMARRVTQLTVCALMVLIPGCGDGSDESTAKKAAAVPPIATTAPSDDDSGTDDVKLDVGGHQIFMACRGSGSPTVVYLHGMGGSAASAGLIPSLLQSDYRVCAYDRINSTGLSDQVEGPLTGKDQVEDLHGLLAGADVPGPYILLGASHGGLLADMYAASYPDEVAGMVLLDAPLPDTFEYEGRYLPRDDLPKPDDWKDSPERVDDLTTFRQAQALQGNEPRIPVTYIGAKRMELPPSYPRKEITAAERRLQRDFLKRFAPGRLVLADSPHYMEPAIPKLIAREVTRLITHSAER